MEDCQKRIHQVEFLEINDVLVDDKERIRITSGKDVDELKDSINDLGLFHPILVNEDNKLIAGYRRLKACKELGWETIPVFIKFNINKTEELSIELQENVRRKNLSPYEIDIALAKLKRIYEELHPETVHLAHIKSKKKRKQNKETKNAQKQDSAPYINEDKQNNGKNGKTNRFTQVAAKFSNYSERTIRERIQVGAAILDKKYDDKTVELYKRGNITHSEMLIKDRKRRKKEKALKEKKKNHRKNKY